MRHFVRSLIMELRAVRDWEGKMDGKEHWEGVYRSKAHDAVSWYRPHLETSLNLICEGAPAQSAAIIDVGGGESTLVDDLLERGYRNLTVLDMSAVALNATKRRLGAIADQITWVESDILQVDLPEHHDEVWHARAVFHFLTEASQRDAYIRVLKNSLKPGARMVIGTFGPTGPTRCSGLDVRRYDVQSLSDEIGAGFELLTSTLEDHRTPAGSSQQYRYCQSQRRAFSRRASVGNWQDGTSGQLVSQIMCKSLTAAPVDTCWCHTSSTRRDHRPSARTPFCNGRIRKTTRRCPWTSPRLFCVRVRDT
jgi:SAM-dependent methyltransferase